jgi:hypothetical protein
MVDALDTLEIDWVEATWEQLEVTLSWNCSQNVMEFLCFSYSLWGSSCIICEGENWRKKCLHY